MDIEDEEDDEGQQQLLQQQWPSSPIPHINGFSGEQQANNEQHQQQIQHGPSNPETADDYEPVIEEPHNFTMDEPPNTTQEVFNFLVCFFFKAFEIYFSKTQTPAPNTKPAPVPIKVVAIKTSQIVGLDEALISVLFSDGSVNQFVRSLVADQVNLKYS